VDTSVWLAFPIPVRVVPHFPSRTSFVAVLFCQKRTVDDVVGLFGVLVPEVLEKRLKLVMLGLRDLNTGEHFGDVLKRMVSAQRPCSLGIEDDAKQTSSLIAVLIMPERKTQSII
jgi:hypothetical protein